MAQITLLTGPERRRRWSADERRRILAAAFAPGAVVADAARQFEVSTSLIYKWRQQGLAAEPAAAFAPAIMLAEPVAAAPPRRRTRRRSLPNWPTALGCGSVRTLRRRW